MISRINVYRKADIVYGSAIHPMPTVGASFTRDRRSRDLEEISAEPYRAPMVEWALPTIPKRVDRTANQLKLHCDSTADRFVAAIFVAAIFDYKIAHFPFSLHLMNKTLTYSYNKEKRNPQNV